jgi:hypothetical protein
MRVNVLDLRQQLLTAKVALESALECLPSSSEHAKTAPRAEAEPAMMKVCDYATARGYAPRTVSRWANLGMPHQGKGKARRIKVREADVWIAEGGPEKAARLAGQRAYLVRASR